jgi:hypothetical protein
MGADYVVHLPCEPKRAFGNGDALEASRADAELLVALTGAKTSEERRRVAELHLGPESPDIQPVHALLRGAHSAWALDVELLMDV